MTVATEFPLPKLDRFEWDQMKLADLTGRAMRRLSFGSSYCSCKHLNQQRNISI